VIAGVLEVYEERLTVRMEKVIWLIIFFLEVGVFAAGVGLIERYPMFSVVVLTGSFATWLLLFLNMRWQVEEMRQDIQKLKGSVKVEGIDST
jgi:hypothetical protein